MKYWTLILLIFFSLAVNSQKVYKTPSGHKYHTSTCRMVNNVSQAITLNDAVEIGLDPCKICKPSIIKKSNLLSTKSTKGESKTVQCSGMTKAGKRCKHMTSIANGYCFQHNPD